MILDIEYVYYNIYRSDYRAGVRYEDTTLAMRCSEGIAHKLLKKRLKGDFPFFLNIHGAEKEDFSLARTGEYSYLYVAITKHNFVRIWKDIILHIDCLFECNKILFGYCGDLKYITKNLNLNNIDEWRHRIFAKHNTVDYDVINEKKLLREDDYFDYICWKNWIHPRLVDTICDF